MEYFSYSSIKSYMDCPYSYFLRYTKKIPSVESSASVFGSAIHNTAKIGYENNLVRDEWVKTFKREWVVLTKSKKDIVYSSDKDFFIKLKYGQKLIGEFYDKYVEGKEPPKKVEFKFSKTDSVKLGSHILVGIFDQIDSNDRIVDYKTGFSKPFKNQLDYDLQFTIYSYAYRQLFNKEETGLVLLHVPSCTEFLTKRTNKDFEILREEIDKVEKSIETNVFVRNLGRNCYNCYFVEHCLG